MKVNHIVLVDSDTATALAQILPILLLDVVAVAPGAQGHGYGALLLARAEDDARELGLPEVRLYTNRAMNENQTFYPRHGYSETARGRQHGYDRVFYTKTIAPPTDQDEVK